MSRVQEGSGFGGGSQVGFSNLEANPGTNVVCSIAMTYPAQIMVGCVCTLTHLPTLQQQTSYHLMLSRAKEFSGRERISGISRCLVALRQMLRGYEMEGWLEGSHQKT
jgi:hypothetical protein